MLRCRKFRHIVYSKTLKIIYHVCITKFLCSGQSFVIWRPFPVKLLKAPEAFLELAFQSRLSCGEMSLLLGSVLGIAHT